MNIFQLKGGVSRFETLEDRSLLSAGGVGAPLPVYADVSVVSTENTASIAVPSLLEDTTVLIEDKFDQWDDVPVEEIWQELDSNQLFPSVEDDVVEGVA